MLLTSATLLPLMHVSCQFCLPGLLPLYHKPFSQLPAQASGCRPRNSPQNKKTFSCWDLANPARFPELRNMNMHFDLRSTFFHRDQPEPLASLAPFPRPEPEVAKLPEPPRPEKRSSAGPPNLHTPPSLVRGASPRGVSPAASPRVVAPAPVVPVPHEKQRKVSQAPGGGEAVVCGRPCEP